VRAARNTDCLDTNVQTLGSVIAVHASRNTNATLELTYWQIDRIIKSAVSSQILKQCLESDKKSYTLPSYTKDPTLGPRANLNRAKEAVDELITRILIRFAGSVSQDHSPHIALPTFVERLDLTDFEFLLGVSVVLKKEEDRRYMGATDRAYYTPTFKIMNKNLPVGKAATEILKQIEERNKALEARRQLLKPAVERINNAILDELETLVDGGVRIVHMPKYVAVASDQLGVLEDVYLQNL
jgi:hypothetical protein